jgi:hypothetical protein
MSSFGAGCIAAFHHDTDVHAFDHAMHAFEVARAEEQQVGGHLRGFRETHMLHFARQLFRGCDRHVGDRHQAGRQPGREFESRLETGLVPAGQEAARVGGLELREQRAHRGLRGAFLNLIVEREQAAGGLADLAVVGKLQPVCALRQRAGESQGDGFDLLVVGDSGFL